MADAQTLPPTTPIGPAFPEPVFDASRSFRSLLTALSRPGTIVGIAADLDAPAPMGRAMAATLLTLCDVDTPVLLDPAYDSTVAPWSDFHTAAPRLDVSEADRARFVFAATPAGRLPIDDLAQGTQAYPDRSATCIWECERLDDEGGHILTGPGIESRATLDCDLIDEAFLEAWGRNGARFPRGIDLILTCGDRLVALPRTTRIGGPL